MFLEIRADDRRGLAVRVGGTGAMRGKGRMGWEGSSHSLCQRGPQSNLKPRKMCTDHSEEIFVGDPIVGWIRTQAPAQASWVHIRAAAVTLPLCAWGISAVYCDDGGNNNHLRVVAWVKMNEYSAWLVVSAPWVLTVVVAVLLRPGVITLQAPILLLMCKQGSGKANVVRV